MRSAATDSRLWLPSDLGSKLQMWLKGDDLTGTNGSSITTWADATANANDATGAPAKPSLVTSGLNGMNTAAFDGIGQYMTLPTGLLTGRTQSASFAVYKLTTDPPSAPAVGPVFGDFGTDATSGNHDPFSDGIFYEDYCSTTRRTVTGIPSSTAFRIFGLRSKSADWRLDVNGTNYYTDGTNTFAANTAACIGSTRVPLAYYLQGQIAEIVDCNDFLMTSEKEQVEGYLAWKWGLQASLPGGHTYAGAAPTIALSGGTTTSIIISAAVSLGVAILAPATHSRAITGLVATSSGLTKSIAKALSGLVTLGASVAVGRLYARSASGTVVGSSSITKIQTSVRTIAGQVAIFGSLPKALSAVRSVTGPVAVKSGQSQVATHPRAVSGLIAVQGSIGRVANYVRAFSGVTVVSAQIQSGKAYLRQVTGSVVTFARVTTQTAFARLISGTVGLRGAASRVLSAIRAVVPPPVAVEGSVSRSAAHPRALTGVVAVFGQVQQGKAFARTIAAAVVGSVSLQRLIARGVTIASRVAVSASLARQLAANRLVSGAVAVGANIARGLSLSRSFAGAVVTSASSGLNVARSRTIAALVVLKAAVIAGAPHPFVPFGPIIKFVRERLPFPRAAREDRTRKF